MQFLWPFIINEISHIYVFAGERDITEANYPDIFSAKELRNIQDKNIPIQIINAFIHGDDTIQRIKEKIFKECKNINNSIPNSMYLFSVTEKKLNSYNTFYNLTQQDSIDLTDIRLKQFLSNIVPYIINDFLVFLMIWSKKINMNLMILINLL